MPKELLDKIKEKILDNKSSAFDIKKFVNIMMCKKMNILIGSGCSSPAIPLWSNVDGKTEEKRFDNLKKAAISVSK